MKSFAQLDEHVPCLLRPALPLYEVALEPTLLTYEAGRPYQLVLLFLMPFVPQLNAVWMAGLFLQVECLAPLGEVATFVVYFSHNLSGAPVNDEIGSRLINVLVSEYLNSFDKHFDSIG